MIFTFLLTFIAGTFLILLFGKFSFFQKKISPITLSIWLSAVIYLSLLFSSPYFLFLLFLMLFIIKLFVQSHLWKKFMKYSLYILFFILLFNIFLVGKGTHVIYYNHFIKITWESLAFAYSMGLRIVIIMGAFSIYNSNITMDELIEILEKFRFPQRSLITLALSLRFFNIMAQEASESVEVLRLRGVAISSGKLKDKIRARSPLMSALLTNSLERSIYIAEALEIKGFPSKNRRAWRRISFPWREKLIVSSFLLLSIIATALVVMMGIGNELIVCPNIKLYFLLTAPLLLLILSRREEND